MNRLFSLAEALRRDVVAGAVLLIAAVIALVWANSPWAADYFALADARVGPAALHLDLTARQWASDGLLAVFFFVVGLELKREFTVGSLSDPRRAALPVVAAVGGMIAPALIFTLLNAGHGTGHGWAIPTATDIAFAVSVLAVAGRWLPPALRVFLLTLAVVDDLLGITIIAVFYSSGVDVPLLAATLATALGFALAARHRSLSRSWALAPLALLTWWLMHQSGVHPTVAGVLLGFAVPVGLVADRLEHGLGPVSAGVALPVFAFFAAGTAVSSDLISEAVASPVTLGVFAGLVLGKPIGIVGSTWLMTRLTPARLDPAIGRLDLLGIAMLAGVGFTVSLLVGTLALEAEELRELAKIGVLAGSMTAAVLATGALHVSGRRRRLGAGVGSQHPEEAGGADRQQQA